MVAADAPRLTAMAVATESRNHFPKRWHVADIKNITSDDRATLRVDQNSANITQYIKIYIYEIAMVLHCHFLKK